MVSPVTLAQISREGANHVSVAFKYPDPVSSFDHAMILLVEQDGAKDSWALASSTRQVNGFNIPVIDYRNTSFGAASNNPGLRDDEGFGQSRLRIIPTRPGWIWTTYRFDPTQTDSDPGANLEFYALVTIVALGGGEPMIPLGDIAITPTLTLSV
jgi:hypothetical protein